MDDRDKRRVGEQVDPGGRPKAPGRLELLQRFINSYNHDFPREWDRLGSPDRAQSWLRQKGLVDPGIRISATEAARLQQLREALRALVMANQGGPPNPRSVDIVRSAARTARLRVAVDDAGQTSLEADETGVGGVIATLLGVLHEAQLADLWPRLKGCRRCGYAFFDRSKNRSSRWCAMAICGNRTKNSAYYRRRTSGR
jgi:predicted RNA-binding Zn ribbon-like protein